MTSTNAANAANAASAESAESAENAENAATPGTAAIILAGGRASRLDGAAKPLLEVGGRTLLDRAIAAVAGCDPIVVGPPVPVHGEVAWTREAPEFGGPVAGIAAGLANAESDEVFVLAADLPNAEEAVALLRRHPPLASGEDGICLADGSGRMQWLIGLYRTDVLRRAVAALPDGGRDASIRSLLAGLAVTAVPAGDLATDVDTWDDLERARATAQTPSATAQTSTAEAQKPPTTAQTPPRGNAPDEETT